MSLFPFQADFVKLSSSDKSCWRILEPCLINSFRSNGLRVARAEHDGTRAETRFRLCPKRTSPFKSVGASVQSTAGSRGVRISLSNVGYTTFGGGVTVLATHSIRQFPLHFPSHASPCATTFRTSSTTRFNIKNYTFCQQSVFLCFVLI